MDEIVMGGMVLETNLKEIVAAFEGADEHAVKMKPKLLS